MAKKNPIQHLIELNIQTKYSLLLKVNFLHDFFIEGALKNIEIVPDNMTKLMLKQYQLKAAQEGSALVIGYGKSVSDHSAIADLKNPLKLSFWVKVNDPNFLNYTAIPFEFGNHIYHFTNRPNDKLEDEYANLSSDQYVSETDRLPISGAVLDYRLDEAQENLKVEVANELGEIVFERQYKGMTSVCSLNLSQEAAGKYTLLLDGLEEFSFYIAPDGAKNIFGVVDIYIDPKDKSPFSLFENSQPVQKKQYNVHFRARSVKWKYIISETNANNPQHSEHEIYDNSKTNKEQKFTDAQNIVLENGNKAVVFSTSTPVAFREIQEQKFKIRTLRGKSGVEWVTDLPNPSAKSLLKVENNSKKDFFSEIMVYL
jgi:hypothetical protein